MGERPSSHRIPQFHNSTSGCELAGRDVLHEGEVGFEEVVGGKLRRIFPANVAKDAVLKFAREFPHVVEAQFYGIPAWVLVTKAGHLISDYCVDSQFFFKFPPESIARLLAFFDLAAGKFPFERHGLMAGALAYQYAVI